MKIAISSKGNNLDSELDPRFGRCKYFLFVDTENMDFEAVSNESIMATGGAGIKAAETVANKGVNSVITGNIGPNAFRTLNAAEIKVFTGASGSIKEVIEKYKNNKLDEALNPTAASHSGMR